MDSPTFLQQLFSPLNTFVMGFALGIVFLIMSIFSHWKTKREAGRHRNLLSDKLDLDAKHMQQTSSERTRLARENENLRIKVAQLNDKPHNKLARELEIYVRAEKKMTVGAPGFGSAWEMAKSEAAAQMKSEESGESLPQRLFSKLLGGGTPANVVQLPTSSSSTSSGTSSRDSSSANGNGDAA
jgi:hypothetical protein